MPHDDDHSPVNATFPLQQLRACLHRPDLFTAPSNSTFRRPLSKVNGAIKCQQISGGDGYSTMGDGTQTYMFAFGPLSGLAKIASGDPRGGTEFPNEFNQVYSGPPLQPGEPATTDDPSRGNTVPGDINLGAFPYNGAIGLIGDLQFDRTLGVLSITESGSVATVRTFAAHGLNVGDPFTIPVRRKMVTTAASRWRASSARLDSRTFLGPPAWEIQASVLRW